MYFLIESQRNYLNCKLFIGSTYFQFYRNISINIKAIYGYPQTENIWGVSYVFFLFPEIEVLF